MVSRVQNIRSTNKNTRPPNSTRQPGEIYVNFADLQMGVITPAQTPQDLIAIRFHSPNTDYAIGDHVIYQGKAYRAKQAIVASVFNPTYWETAGMADAPADNKLYGRINNTWDIPEIGDVLNLQASLDAKAPLASPAFSGTPTAATAAAATNSSQLATTAFVKGQNYAAIGGPELLARVAKVGDTMTGPLTLPADPTVPLHAATKQYVDNKPSGASTIDTPPSSAVNGQLWWETDTGGLFVRYDDGSSQQWVQLNGEMGNAVQKTGDTMTGQLTLTGANPLLMPDKGQVSYGKGGVPYWHIGPGAGTGTDDFNFYDAQAANTLLTLASGQNQVVVNGTLNVGNSIQSSGGALITKAAGPGANAHIMFRNPTDQVRWYIYWSVTNENLVFQGPGGGGQGMQLNVSGRLDISYGWGCKAGVSGAWNVSAFNLDYVAGVTHLWIDNTNFGGIAISSDYRIKKDVQDLPSTWDTVKNLRPISYTQAEFTPPSQRELDKDVQEPFIQADDIERWGFIAHELQEDLLPSAASGEKDQPDAIQSLNLAPVVAALTKALQEAMTRIEALEGAAQAPAPTQHKNRKGA